MEKRTRRTFDANFKHNALRMVFDEGVPLEEVARKLDIHRQVLHRWKQDYKQDPKNAFPGRGRRKDLEEENRKLRQALKNAEEEREILKKTLTILSRPKSSDSGL
ncbi:MAG: transposase [Elusimicrobia bacterium]|nr:transposase [Elusimicrobiota bacterium]MBK8127155.1 transposase [Elusimicrobiota bacterium]MBK9058294.1 transposase [Elusimicrobiota bacterium]MBK9429534.1 transposase [Elusimicrobiota bacterium]MBL0251088.1 transposase [Elusimicrobiota bacterium]